MDLLKLIGSRKRLEILKLLSRADMYVSEIMELAQMDGKRTKHHLDLLEESGIIKSYRKGRRRYYHLEKEIRLEITSPPSGRFLLFITED